MTHCAVQVAVLSESAMNQAGQYIRPLCLDDCKLLVSLEGGRVEVIGHRISSCFPGLLCLGREMEGSWNTTVFMARSHTLSFSPVRLCKPTLSSGSSALSTMCVSLQSVIRCRLTVSCHFEALLYFLDGCSSVWGERERGGGGRDSEEGTECVCVCTCDVAQMMPVLRAVVVW